MFRNPTLIRVLNTVALVIFILVMVVCLILAVFGFAAADSIFSSLEDTTVYHGSDTVSGWATIGAAIGVGLGSLGGIGAAVVGAMGVFGAVVDLLVYLPALIARKIHKKNGSIKAYWILMGLWLLPSVICMILFLAEGGLVLLGF